MMLLMSIVLLIAYINKHPMIFTLIFIALVTLFVYRITDNYVPVAFTIAGLILAHHSVQPFFYPISVKNESKEKYITCMYSNGKICPFDENEDVNTQNPAIDCYLHNEEIYTIKLPLIPIFKSIAIQYPATEKLEFDNCGVTRYNTVPFIASPKINGNTLILNLKVSAWTITEINYPIKFNQKISEKPKIGFGSISYYYPYSKEDNIESINKMDEYGITVTFSNNEQVPLIYTQYLSEITLEDTDFWAHRSRDHLQVSYANGDLIGIFKGHLYCRIASKLEPWERRYYYLSSKGEGKLLNY